MMNVSPVTGRQGLLIAVCLEHYQYGQRGVTHYYVLSIIKHYGQRRVIYHHVLCIIKYYGH